MLHHGVATLSSAHLTLALQAGAETVTASGDEKLANAKLLALNITEKVTGFGSLRLLSVGGRTYVGLPAAQNRSGKPWVLVRATSRNSFVRILASSLASLQQSAGVAQYTAFVTAAEQVRLDGPATVGGVPATHYSIVVDVRKLPTSSASKQAIIRAGLSSIPVELWVDGQGRPLKVTDTFSIAGQTFATTATLSRFDAPLTITAPPASQVDTS